MKLALIIITSILSLVILVMFLIVQGLASQVSTLYADHSADKQSVSNLTQQLAQDENKLNSLNQPSDPLSAYNQICNSDNTNSVTGVTQIYYYPCTNSIIPAAG